MDIICVQEHWLFTSDQKLLGEVDKNITYVAKSVDDDDPEYNLTARRGYGGVAILWKSEIDDKIKALKDGSSRIQIIQIQTEPKPICLVNVYMPSDSKISDTGYKDAL